MFALSPGKSPLNPQPPITPAWPYGLLDLRGGDQPQGKIGEIEKKIRKIGFRRFSYFFIFFSISPTFPCGWLPPLNIRCAMVCECVQLVPALSAAWYRISQLVYVFESEGVG